MILLVDLHVQNPIRLYLYVVTINELPNIKVFVYTAFVSTLPNFFISSIPILEFPHLPKNSILTHTEV